MKSGYPAFYFGKAPTQSCILLKFFGLPFVKSIFGVLFEYGNSAIDASVNKIGVA